MPTACKTQPPFQPCTSNNLCGQLEQVLEGRQPGLGPNVPVDEQAVHDPQHRQLIQHGLQAQAAGLLWGRQHKSSKVGPSGHRGQTRVGQAGQHAEGGTLLTWGATIRVRIVQTAPLVAMLFEA